MLSGCVLFCRMLACSKAVSAKRNLNLLLHALDLRGAFPGSLLQEVG